MCEELCFRVVSELVAHKFDFLSNQRGICLTRSARDVHFDNTENHA